MQLLNKIVSMCVDNPNTDIYNKNTPYIVLYRSLRCYTYIYTYIDNVESDSLQGVKSKQKYLISECR